ncbi:restriction endonuclease subunit S [Synechocystis sp. FACHB-383]|uniref:restriction endonuclease subunit S n=1 Tax=Synechocystis sp. FACHB-383 TaxID=2692864 RepID=UPI001686CCD5|nr:restriction endonuclease subunit S [Synechocystis sp. FACHB-383]
MIERHEKYKNSGIAWLGEIPEHWEVIKLKYIGESIIGMTYSPDDVVPNQGTLVLRSSNIQDGKLSLNDCVYIQKDIPDKLRVKKGDILICSRNGSRALIGKNITIDEATEGQTFGAFMTVFRTELSEFVSKYFNSQVFNGQSGLFLTATINQLTINTINNFFIALPHPEEQGAIAAFLDRKTAEIDELIAQKERLIELYEEEKTAIINEAVTKGINPDVKLKPSGIDWLGDIPEHWQIVPMTKYLDSIVDYRGRTPKKIDTGLFLVTAKNIKGGIIDYSLSEEYVDRLDAQSLLDRGTPEIGDVLFTTEAPLGEVANIDREDIALAQRVIKFRGKEKVLDNYFLKYWLMCNSFQQDLYTYATGSTALGIKASKLPKLLLLLPPLEEQRAIAAYIEKECARIDAKIAKTKRIIELQKEYRTALISEAVTGKIKVPELVA